MKKGIFRTILTAFAVASVCAIGCMFGACNKKKPTATPTKEYQIMYSDGTQTHTITVKSGALYSIENIPYKEGYTFLGWFDEEEDGRQYINGAGMCIEPYSEKNNILLYPQYKPNEYYFALEYGVGEKQMSALTVYSDEKIDGLPIVQTLGSNYGFEFQGWYTEEDCKGLKITDEKAVSTFTFDKSFRDMVDASGTIRLYAGYKARKHVVRFFDKAGSIITSYNVEHGKELSDVAPKSHGGYVIAEWSRYLNGSPFTGKIENSMDLYVLSYAYTVTLDTKGGYSISPLIVAQGKSVVLPKATRGGYDFVGWIDKDGNALDIVFQPTSDCTVYATWTPATYHVTLNVENGADLGIQDVVYGEEYEFPPPTAPKDGYAFAGWATQKGDLLTNAKGESIKAWNIVGDTTLYAKYKKYVTVTFDSDGGTPVESKRVLEGTTIDLPIIQKSGYVMEYWNNGYTNHTLKYTPYGDVVLKAIWFCTSATYTNQSQLTIQDVDTNKNPYDTVSVSTLFGKTVAQIKTKGFTKMTCTISFTIKEKNQGYQEIYFGKSIRLDQDLSSRDAAVWSKTALEANGTRSYSYTFTANLTDIYDTMYICYSAHGSLEDDWYRQNISLTMQLS